MPVEIPVQQNEIQMNTTPEELGKRLAEFIGGQIEIQSLQGKYIYRGEIKSAAVESGELSVMLSWMAKGEGYPPVPKQWVVDPHSRYDITLVLCSSIANIGDGRICLQNPYTAELVVLFPLGGSRLEPVRVKGLTLTAA